MDHQTTGQRIADCRKKLGLSQEALGEKVGVSRQAISKWEADAAMPEIDKLIALSRLFSVSVGWLLGVEELPEPRSDSTQVSEELLHRLEQLYKPRRKLPLWGKILAAVSALLLIWGGIGLAREWQYTRHQVSHLAGQMMNNNNSNIISKLNALEDRIDSINDTIEREAAVLAAYDFQINAEPGQDTAFVYLNAIPKTWNESWTATLSVRYEGSESMCQTCAWDGSALVGGLKLKLLDGYECWLVISYPDGSQEQVPLRDEAVERLKSATSITCRITGSGVPLVYTGGQSLPLASYNLYLSQPTALGLSSWVHAEYVLYHIRDGVRTVADRNDMSPMDDAISITQEFWGSSQMDMRIPEIESNDRLELWFEAELENGLSCAVTVDSWVFRRGQFLRED